MITFIICLVLLILGYIIYSRIVEKIFGINVNKVTPAYEKRDDVDYIPMSTWRVFMIQFLNIAGVGPIFGAVMGAMYGTSSFLWIVFGSIFAGGVHDYISGMISLREGGINLPQIQAKYLGNIIKPIMRILLILLLVLCGAVFVSAPAGLLQGLLPVGKYGLLWILLIVGYYFIATMLPINKIIGRVYPLFGAFLLFMAFGIMIMFFIKQPDIPEIWDGLQNRTANPQANPIFPMMFISIACGAISGFHATQSTLMARCMKNEKNGRPVFYGSMIMEGIVALVWAAAASFFFYNPETGAVIHGQTIGSAASVVSIISKSWLGKVGGIIAIMGVVAAAVSTGDTAFRSARLILADALHINQKSPLKRLMVTSILLAAGGLILWYSMADKEGFNTIWQYFAWTNQTLACVTLWAVSVLLAQEKKLYWISLIPAAFMTVVSVTYIMFDDQSVNLNYNLSLVIGLLFMTIDVAWFFIWKHNYFKKHLTAQNKPLP